MTPFINFLKKMDENPKTHIVLIALFLIFAIIDLLVGDKLFFIMDVIIVILEALILKAIKKENT